MIELFVNCLKKFHIFNFFFKIMRSSLYGNAIYLILNTSAASLLGFAFWTVMARIFTPAEVGIGSVLVSVSMMLAALSNLGLGIGLVRYMTEAGPESGQLINASFSISSIAAVAGSLIYLAGIKWWSPALEFLNSNLTFIILFTAFNVATVLSNLIDQTLIARRTTAYVFIKNLIINLLKIPLAVFVFAGLSGFGIFTGTGVAVLVGVLISLYWILPAVHQGYIPCFLWSGCIMKKVLPYSLFNNLGIMLSSSPNFIYPLLVLNVLGPEASAYFYISWTMTTFLAIIPMAAAQSLLAEASHQKSHMGPNLLRSFNLAIMISIPATVVVFLLSGWMLSFFGQLYMENGRLVVQYLSLSLIPQCISFLYQTVNQINKRVYLIVAQNGALAVLTLVLGWWLVKYAGLPGIGAAYSIAHLIIAFVVSVPLYKEYKTHCNNSDVEQVIELDKS